MHHFALLAEPVTVLRRLHDRGLWPGLKRERWAVERIDHCLTRLSEPAFAEQVRQAIGHERAQRRGRIAVAAERRRRPLQQRAELQSSIDAGQLWKVGKNLHRPLRLTTEAKRVA